MDAPAPPSEVVASTSPQISGQQPISPTDRCSDSVDDNTLCNVDTPARSAADFAKIRDFWYEDGTVVLISGTRGAFRVYKGILASRSGVFRGMFSSSSPHADEMIEGCPTVRLSDTSDDLEHFLRALMPSPCLPVVNPRDGEKISPEALLAVARLAHKYEVDALLHQALGCLQEYYTPRFDVWLRSSEAHFAACVPVWPPYHSIGVVNRARLTGTRSMLPIALYECSLLRGEVVHGWARDDGVTEHLDARDLERCIDGMYGLAQEGTKMWFQLLDGAPPSARCATAPECKAVLAKVDREMRKGGADAIVSGKTALFSNSSIIQGWRKKEGLCKACATALLERDVEERRKVWAELPSIFGLSNIEGWDSGTPNSGAA